MQKDLRLVSRLPPDSFNPACVTTGYFFSLYTLRGLGDVSLRCAKPELGRITSKFVNNVTSGGYERLRRLGLIGGTLPGQECHLQYQ